MRKELTAFPKNSARHSTPKKPAADPSRRVHFGGVLPRALFGFGTTKGWAAAGAGLIFDRIGQMNLLILVIWLPNEADVQIVP